MRQLNPLHDIPQNQPNPLNDIPQPIRKMLLNDLPRHIPLNETDHV